MVCNTRFQPYRIKSSTCSKPCYRRLSSTAAAAKAYRAQAHVKERKNAVRRVENNPLRREVNLRNNLRRYGITLEEYVTAMARQGGRCAICGDPPDPNGIRAAARLHVDHDHTTGRNRDLLCCRCNQGIGYFRDDPALFHRAAEYIERHRQESDG